MKKFLIPVSVFFALVILVFLRGGQKSETPEAVGAWWEVQSVDTMKYSRDLAREKLGDSKFDETIELQIKNIAEIGATHVAIGTPYDEEFVPFSERWVMYAREYGLSVWFRGNFSGWEGWFGYDLISEEEHHALVRNFILNNRELFEEGDIFTPCPECENGGTGDPRLTKKVSEFRQFLVEEHNTVVDVFDEIGKNVTTSYFSMNGDVAALVMDKDTTESLGGAVVIDHYVASPEQLVNDAVVLSGKSGGEIVFGEMGVPIPDIHGNLSEDEQAEWLERALTLMAREPAIKGVNYWVLTGGSTGLWNDSGTKRQAADVLRRFYQPTKVNIKVTSEFGQPVPGATVEAGRREFISNHSGIAEALVVPGISEVTISAEGYKSYALPIDLTEVSGNVVLKSERETFLFKLRLFVRNLLP